MVDQLSKTFDLPSDEDLTDAEAYIKINLPENPALRDIVTLALQAYSAQMGMAGHVEPKYRHRTLEVAQTYLQTAMDAIAKDRELMMKQEKQDRDANKDKDESETGLLDRDTVLNDIDTVNRSTKPH